MSETQIQRTEQPTVAFVLSLLAGLWMLAAGGMMGGFGWGGMMGLVRHGCGPGACGALVYGRRGLESSRESSC